MAHSAEFKPTPTTDNTHRTGEEEEKNHVMRPIVVVNLDQIMNEVEKTTKSVLSCIDDNQVLYQDQNNSQQHIRDNIPVLGSTNDLHVVNSLSRPASKTTTYGHVRHRDVQRDKHTV